MVSTASTATSSTTDCFAKVSQSPLFVCSAHNSFPTFMSMPPSPRYQFCSHPSFDSMFNYELQFIETAGLSSSSSVFPLKLDISGCLRELQKRQQLGSEGRSNTTARKRSHQDLNRSSSSSSTAVGSSGSNNQHYKCHNNKKLKLVLQKKLTGTDTSALGRIVVPKYEAESNLPLLVEKEGIFLLMKDAHSSDIWRMRYKYWSNNGSRMYVLDNAGDFVRKNDLQCGDLMTIFQDEEKQYLICVKHLQRSEPPLLQHKFQEVGMKSKPREGPSTNAPLDTTIEVPRTPIGKDDCRYVGVRMDDLDDCDLTQFASFGDLDFSYFDDKPDEQ